MNNRRSFIKKSVFVTAGSLVSLPVIFSKNIPKGLELLAPIMPQETLPDGKHKDLIVLNDKPWNIETPAHLLDDLVTPTDKVFVRNNGLPPQKTDINQWKLLIDGESVDKNRTFSFQELRDNYKHYTYQITLECGGNGRSEFNPPASGNQWTTGAVYAAKWTGIRLKDVLADVAIKSNAVYIGYYGTDTHLSNDPNKVVISRGVPMHKAMEDETLLAFEMNGEPLPMLHGWPMRLVVGGWPASVSGKWLKKISVRNKVHDGEKMLGDSYRVPCEAVAPGSKVPDEAMCIIESMPLKSIITYPKSGAMMTADRTLKLRGHAWAGDFTVQAMHISIDFGATWQECKLTDPANRFAWQHWSAEIQFPKKGYYEVWAKATDSQDKSQPMVVPGWNPKGYLNNACHRIAVKVV
jgi:sulfite oxidase